ncbi:uncharacterized protein LOC124192457 [Daphnia pulex]|uniref:uncharacterized protein LOC124192457 n=1 Tax=Daphnia pulex TaxID=6669 RepID=UPI001EDEE001|nr:uncharacterized protein LOC124192457 [Daphnia pulex]
MATKAGNGSLGWDSCFFLNMFPTENALTDKSSKTRGSYVNIIKAMGNLQVYSPTLGKSHEKMQGTTSMCIFLNFLLKQLVLLPYSHRQENYALVQKIGKLLE